MAKSKAAKQAKQSATNCPCGSGLSYKNCCERYISGSEKPLEAQALMRSRYTAYVLADEAYLQKTWHASTRPALVLEDQNSSVWIGLVVVAHHQQGTDATVEFVATCKINGRAHRMHEKSRFVCEDGQWLYIDGEFSN